MSAARGAVARAGIDGPPGETLRGIPALPSRRSDLRAALTVEPVSALTKRLIITEYAKTGAALRAYDVDMTKRLHLIVVSADLATFLHVHPVLSPDGRFAVTLTVPRPATYHVYADAIPTGYGHHVFRFDVRFGPDSAAQTPAPRTFPSRVSAGPYSVVLDRTTIAAGTAASIGITIEKNGRPAPDLHPYLGGLAHAVFIDIGDLSYVHVHPTAAGMADMSGMSGMHAQDVSASQDMGGAMEMPDLPDTARVDPHMSLHVLLPRAGVYALWLQFRGGEALHVAPFSIRAEGAGAPTAAGHGGS